MRFRDPTERRFYETHNTINNSYSTTLYENKYYVTDKWFGSIDSIDKPLSKKKKKITEKHTTEGTTIL